jgi:hypothetical protein
VFKLALSSALLSVLCAFTACSTPTTSSKGQLITCTTDPSSGVILNCAPGGDDSGSGSATCQDIDEDGDGDCHDADDDNPSSSSSDDVDDDDDDNDGIPDSDDCDEHQGEDGDDHGGSDDSAHADLPYDVRPALGSTTSPVIDAFASEGGQPASIVSVTMDGGNPWRLAELQAGTPFVVTQDDCDHAGNRDIGRDRVIVTWQNADGSTESDHLDIRYCN